MEEPRLVKKDDIDMINQKKVLIMMSIFVLIILIGPSYALLSNFKKLDNAVNVTTANMNMSITQSSSITLEGKLPESDASGLLNATPVSVTVKNANTGPFTNTETTKFQNQNASTVKIIKYELKLIPDTNQTTTLDNQYIKYAVSTDNGTTYSHAMKLTDSNTIVYAGYYLGLGQTKTILLKLWIDGDAGSNGTNKNYYGSIQVEMYQNVEGSKSASLVIKNIKENKLKRENNTPLNYITETDNNETITYLSGCSKYYLDQGASGCTQDNTIDFNYVWYSGRMWRITSFNETTNTIKLITEQPQTSIAYGENATGGVSFYTDANTKSYMYNFLNDEFYDSLYNPTNFIDNTIQWNATQVSSVSTKPANTTMVTSNVGLLNSYEYYKSYEKVGSSNKYDFGYLNIGQYWWLLNSYSASNVWSVISDGNAGRNGPTNANVARPSINLKSTVNFTGSGTESDPYKIVGDKEVGTINTKLNTRTVGEYVKLKSNENEQVFRIVGFEGTEGSESTKLIQLDYVKENETNVTKKFATSSSSGNGTIFGEGNTVDDTNNTTWYSYLKNVYISNLETTYGSNLFTTGEYYLGINADSPSNSTTYYNYRTSICESTSDLTKNCTKSRSKTLEAGLLRYGEMFATQHGIGYNTKTSSYNTANMWLMTRRNASNVKSVYDYGSAGSNSPAFPSVARPSINLSSDVVIKTCDSTLCDGTPSHPYVVGM